MTKKPAARKRKPAVTAALSKEVRYDLLVDTLLRRWLEASSDHKLVVSLDNGFIHAFAGNVSELERSAVAGEQSACDAIVAAIAAYNAKNPKAEEVPSCL